MWRGIFNWLPHLCFGPSNPQVSVVSQSTPLCGSFDRTKGQITAFFQLSPNTSKRFCFHPRLYSEMLRLDSNVVLPIKISLNVMSISKHSLGLEGDYKQDLHFSLNITNLPWMTRLMWYRRRTVVKSKAAKWALQKNIYNCSHDASIPVTIITF